MSESTLTLTVVHPEGKIIKSNLTFVSFKTPAGELGIYPGHSPMMAALNSGWIHFIDPQQGHDFLFIPKGFAQVDQTSISIIADFVDTVSDVDLEKVKEDLDRAENRLTSRHNAHDITEALAARDHARSILEIVEKQSKITQS